MAANDRISGVPAPVQGEDRLPGVIENELVKIRNHFVPGKLQVLSSFIQALVLSVLLVGCSIHTEPLRKYEPIAHPLSSIKLIAGEFTVTTGKTLSVDEAMAIGLAHNYALRIARQEVDIAKGQLRQAKLLDNPELEFSIFSSSAADTVLGIAGSLLQPIPLFWPKRQVTIAVAEASVQRAEAEIQRFEWELRVGIRRTYLQTILQQNEKAFFEQSLAIIDRLSLATGQLKAAGEVSRLSELLVQSEEIEARARLIESESALVKKRSELATLLGVAELSPLPEGTLEFPETLTIEPKKLPRILAAGNVEIYLRDAEVRLAELSKAAASTGWWPTPKVGVSAERNEDSDRLFGGILSLDLPIFNRNQGEIESQTAALAKARLDREQAEFVGRLTLERVAILLSQTQQLISIYRHEGLLAVEENLALVQRAITAGELSTLELIAARQKSIAMNLAYLQARSACVEILLDLEAVLGTPVFELQMAYATPQEKSLP